MSKPEPKAILTLRDTMAAVQAGARAHDPTSALAAAATAHTTAAQFFGDAPPDVLQGFVECLSEIQGHLRSGQFDEAFQLAEYFRQLFQKLAMEMPANGHLPDLVEEMGALQAEMSKCDQYVGRLCQETFDDRSPVDEMTMFGMMHILAYAFAGQFLDSDTPASLLADHVEKHPAQAGEIDACRMMAAKFLDHKSLQQLERNARMNSVPRLVVVTTALVRSIENNLPRPKGPGVRGHYSLLARVMFTVGLLVAISQPVLARELAQELKADRA